MKSVLQAAWLMTVAGGNLIVVIIAEGQFISDQVTLSTVDLFFLEYIIQNKMV